MRKTENVARFSLKVARKGENVARKTENVAWFSLNLAREKENVARKKGNVVRFSLNHTRKTQVGALSVAAVPPERIGRVGCCVGEVEAAVDLE
ncbi:hypothetical protein [uncultured Acetobacteroides sp.]|uniref:hypothetical protein n=1 Tax=uncultured Acetobacteroides sp. TaxID=1760811 RepID=UPI0029F4889A|nr:hypothetical protein [uncultured Acetobacteroides sp.]